jgi:Flp pilus assembly protein TadB
MARWRITRRYARRRSVGVLLSAVLLLIGFALFISALVTIAVADNQSQASSESAQESREKAASLGIWGTLVAYIGSVLLVVATRHPALPNEEALDVTSGIRIEHAGNLFFIIMLIALCLVSVLAVIFIGRIAIPIGPTGLVFLLILRRAYVEDRRREAVRRQDVG